jgi:hypothetical protein
VPQFRDPHDAEQAERTEALLALEPRRIPERLARLEQQFALDRFGARALVAHDDHVVHEHLRALADGEPDVSARPSLLERHIRIERGALVPAIQVLELNAIVVLGDLHIRECLARSRPHDAPDLRLSQDGVAFYGDAADDDPRPFVDGERHLYPAIGLRCRPWRTGQRRLLAVDRHARVAACPVMLAQGADAAFELRFDERFAGLEGEQLQKLGSRQGIVAVHHDVGQHVPGASRNRERDDEVGSAFFAGVRRARIAIPARVEVLLDGPRGIFEQIFIRGTFTPNRDELVADVGGKRIARERDRDTRAAIHRNAHRRLSPFREERRMRRPRLVIPARPQVVFVARQPALNRRGVVFPADAQFRLTQQPYSIRRLEPFHRHASDPRACAGVDLEHEHRPIRIVEFVNPRRDCGPHEPPFLVQRKEVAGNIACPAGRRQGTETLGDDLTQIVFRQSERSFEHQGLHRMSRHEHEAHEHAVAG